MSRRPTTCRSQCISRDRTGIVTNEPRVFSEGMDAVKGRHFMATNYCTRPECLPARSREVEKFTGEAAQAMPDGVGGAS